MTNRNYQKELEQIIQKSAGKKRTLFLHCCCAPCSSYVLEYLCEYFEITVFFYNPNITEQEEYRKRKEELKRYLSEVPFRKEIKVTDADYDPQCFLSVAKGYEEEPERGRRCERCFRLRLEQTAKKAKEAECEFFCTTLSISPHKDARLLMALGEELGEKYGIAYLPSDFKKKNGYQRSIELSRQYGLYRQDYCGCVYSRTQRNQTHR